MQDLHKMQIEIDQNNTPVQWNTAVKFLMARKFDTYRALELYRSHEVCVIRLPYRHNTVCSQTVDIISNSMLLITNDNN